MSYTIAQYLTSNPLIAVFLALGVGGLLGKLKVKGFAFGATISTLVVAFVLNLYVGCYDNGGEFLNFGQCESLKPVFFYLFIFVLGYEVGPAFVKALGSPFMMKIVGLALAYAFVAGLSACGVAWVRGYETETVIGMFAGTFTQSALLGDAQGHRILAYTMTYLVGTLSAVLFARYVMPWMLRIDLLKSTKLKAEKVACESVGNGTLVKGIGIVRMRVFKIEEHCAFLGKTIADVETFTENMVEVQSVERDGKPFPLAQDVNVHRGDVLVVIGDIAALNALDDHGFDEITERKYFTMKQCEADIVLTVNDSGKVKKFLTDYGVLLRDTMRCGALVGDVGKMNFRKGDVLHVHGTDDAVKQVTARLGYLKDNGITTDIPFLALAIMIGLIVGTLKIGIVIGGGLGVLILGLLSGWFYDRCPRRGRITESTRWFIKSLGLNLFIAVVGLTVKLRCVDLMNKENLILLGLGVLLAITVRIVVMYFGRYVLKLDDVDLIGGLCGSGTSTPAMNEVMDYTGSSLYTLSFAPAYAVGNVALIIVGLLLAQFYG